MNESDYGNSTEASSPSLTCHISLKVSNLTFVAQYVRIYNLERPAPADSAPLCCQKGEG